MNIRRLTLSSQLILVHGDLLTEHVHLLYETIDEEILGIEAERILHDEMLEA